MAPPPDAELIRTEVLGVGAEWDLAHGVFRFNGMPAVIMWIESGLAGLMAGLEATVGQERFLLALQAEGRRTSHIAWETVRKAASFEEGVAEASRFGRLLGWGEVTLVSIDRGARTCTFRAKGSFEMLYQKALGVKWGSGMLLGRMAGLCSLYFGTNCWATQTRFEAAGDEFDEFVVAPSTRDIDQEAERLLETDAATRADLAVALQRLRQEMTERTHAEQALRMSEARFSSIVKTALDCIISIDAEQRVVVFNATAERTFGWPAAEALGRRLDDFIPEQFRATHQQRVADYAAHGATQRTMGSTARVAALRRNGEQFQAEAYIARTEVAGAQVMTVTLRDLTEQLRQEAEHKALSEQLRHAQRLEAIGTLAGGIAHDFNNVLGAIFGHLDLAERRLETGRSALDDLKEIRRASQRARDLVQQILTFSRKAGRAERVVSINEAVDEVARLLRATLPAHVRLAPRYGNATASVVADPSELHQVVMNLCTNAWHAIGDRSGTIDVLVDEVACDEDLARTHRSLKPGRYVRLTITDDGTGMDPATLERIFEPFFSTKETGKGTGLGLAVVHGIVEGLGGAIVVQSEQGRGTSFVVYLPAAATTAPKTPAPSAPTAPRMVEGKGQRILFVDDEPALVRAYSRVLVSAGFQVVSAPGGAEAIALLEADPARFDLLLTDYNMPRRSGFDVARAAASLAPGLPVLLASGFITDEVRRGAAELGIKQLLSKPFSTEDLLAAVLRAVRASGGPPT